MKSQKSKPLAGASFSAGFSLKFLRACGALLPAVVVGVAAAPRAFADDVPPEPAAPAAETAAPNEPETPEKVAKLPTTVVVASRTEVELDKVSPSVSVVSGEELASQQVRTVADALSREAGITSVSAFGAGTGTQVLLRGTDTNSTVVMLDGRIFPGGTGGGAGLETMGTENLSSVQILRGSASTLYGANAIGGAIDLRMVSGLDVDGAEGSLGIELGSFASRRYEMSFAGNTNGEEDLLDGLGFSMGFSYSETGGWMDGPSSSDLTNFLPRVDWKISDKLAIDVVARIFENHYDFPAAGGYSASEGKWSGHLVSPEIVLTPNEDLRVKALYSYSKVKQELITWQTDNTDEMQQISLQADYRVSDVVSVSAGYDFVEDDYRIYDFSPWGSDNSAKDYRNSIWAMAHVSPIADLDLTGGLRYTDTNHYGDETTFELAASYKIAATGTTLFAKVSTGFNTPTYLDMCPSAYYVAVPDLDPEKSKSYEIGVKQNLFDDQLKIGATLFRIDTKDLIQYVDMGNWMGAMENVSKARSEGVELSFEANPKAAQELRVYGNATFMNAENRTDDIRLTYRPKFEGTLGAEYAVTEDLSVGASVSYVASRYASATQRLDDYVLGRAYGNYVVKRYTDGRELLTLTARLENVFDQNYDTTGVGYEAPGFGAFAGARLSF